MVIEHPGHVTDRIILLGRKESCVYLLDGGSACTVIGGGFAYIAEDVTDQLKCFEIDERKIERIVILHSHFDHCGIVPYLKDRWPWANITASARGKVMLSRADVMQNIKALNRMMVQEREPWPGFEEKFHIEIDTVVEDGSVLSCGDRSLEFITVPGHSSCSIALYVPEEKAMFPSDAAGIPLGDGVLTTANSNYDDYMDSLNKIFQFDFGIILTEHFGARTGEDCRFFMDASAASAVETRRLLEESYERTKDVQKSVAEITEKIMALAPKDFFFEMVISLVVGQMLNYISRIRSKE